MLFYSDKARTSAINKIEDVVNKLGNIKCSELSYIDYLLIVRYLNMLKEEIIKESKSIESRKNKCGITYNDLKTMFCGYSFSTTTDGWSEIEKTSGDCSVYYWDVDDDEKSVFFDIK